MERRVEGHERRYAGQLLRKDIQCLEGALVMQRRQIFQRFDVTANLRRNPCRGRILTSAGPLQSLKTLCMGHSAFEKLRPDAATHQVDVALSCAPQR